MFTKSFPLFKLLGFSVRADWSWLLIFVLITWSLAGSLFPAEYPGLVDATYLAMGFVGAVGLFGSIVLHELGHAVAARRNGVEMTGITLFVFGGVAHMRDEPPSPRAEFVIAVAGPIVSVILGGLFLALYAAGTTYAAPASVNGVLAYLGWINLIVVAFNLVPAFPLDGGRMLRAALWHYKGNLRWATRITSALGSTFGTLLIVLGVLALVSGNVVGGVWWFILGLFLRSAAQMSYQQLLVRRALEGETVERFMQSDVRSVPPDITLQTFVDDYVYRYHHKMFPVVTNGALRGCMTTAGLKSTPREEWSQRRVEEVAEPCGEPNTIDVHADATEALSKMSSDGHSRLMVVDGEALRGVLSLRDMMTFIANKVDLEQEPLDVR